MNKPAIVIVRSQQEYAALLRKSAFTNTKQKPAIDIPLLSGRQPVPASAVTTPSVFSKLLADEKPKQRVAVKQQPSKKAQSPRSENGAQKPENKGGLISIREFCSLTGQSQDDVLLLCQNDSLPKGVFAVQTGESWFLFVENPELIKKVQSQSIAQFWDVVNKAVPQIREIPKPPVQELIVVPEAEPLKLTHNQVNQLRSMMSQNYSTDALKKVFGISETEIRWHCYDLLGIPQPPANTVIKEKRRPGRPPQIRMPQEPPKAAEKKTVSEKVKEASKVIEAPIPYEEPEEYKAPKEKVKVFLSIATLRDRFRKKCTKNGKHWIWMGMDIHSKPLFSIDGKQYPIKKASYMLYKTETSEPAKIPHDYDVVATCGKYNCVSPECISVVPLGLSRSAKRVDKDVVAEVTRLRELGKTPKEIADIMSGNGTAHEGLTPRNVNRISNGWLGGKFQ